MQLQIIILNEVRNRKTNTYDIAYMWNLRYDKKELTYETDRLMDMENRLVTAREEGQWGGTDWESGISGCGHYIWTL